MVSLEKIGQDAVTTRVFGPHFCGAARRDELVALVERMLVWVERGRNKDFETVDCGHVSCCA